MAKMTPAEVADFKRRVATERENEFQADVVAIQSRLEATVREIGELRFRDHYGTDRGAIERAADIAHTISWMIPNLNLGLLVKHANATDLAMRASREANKAMVAGWGPIEAEVATEG